MVDLKILECDWLRPFWPIKKQDFHKYKIWAVTQKIIQILIIEQMQWKLLTTFFFKLKTPISGPFLQFSEQKMFFQKIWLSHAEYDKGF